MKNHRLIFIAVAVLVFLLAVAGLLHLYNTGQQEAKQRAIASLDHGIALFREKKYAESLEELQSIPDGVIKDWHLPYYTATAHVMLKDYQAAAPILEEALALNPQETRILFELGVVYFKLGKLNLSKSYFASVVEIDPSNEEARGLMDIMAKLERQQPGATLEESPGESDSGAEGH
jgi:tetratricopeptide (TPR) repeat protein